MQTFVYPRAVIYGLCIRYSLLASSVDVHTLSSYQNITSFHGTVLKSDEWKKEK